MTGLTCLVCVICAICIASPAMGEELIVQNASFEDSVLSEGEATVNGAGLDHWTPEPGEWIGLWNLSNLLDYPGGAPDGVNVAYSGGPAISQILSDVVVEGKTYILTLKVGNSPCCGFPGYGVQLLANGVILAEDANSIPVPSGTFKNVDVTYTSPPADSNAGNQLEIRLLSLGPEVTFDDISLTAIVDANRDWELVDTNGAVSRGGASMAYDSARGVIVMFGGWGTGPLADTWEYNDTCRSWSPVTTANSPPARVWYSMVYDSNRQRIILFGGSDPATNTFFNDTWEYVGTNWQQIITSHRPPEMQARTMVFDSGRNRTVLVGGEGPGGWSNATWEYDGSDWTQVATPVSPPPPGALAAMAYAPDRQRTILTFNDVTQQLATWEYDGLTWAEVTTAASPVGRWAHTMVYDTCSQRVVLFGGYSPYYASGSSMNDTWEYDGSEWTQIETPHAPGPADQHAMAFDAANELAVILRQGETWVYTNLSTDEESCGFLPAQDPFQVKITSPNLVLESKPTLINIPQKTAGVQLSASLVSNGATIPLDPSQVSYHVSHPEAHVIPNPESIISIDAGGVAHYNSEGYVSATATATTDACQSTSAEFLLATGDDYGNPLTDDVIAVFPTDYVLPESSFSFGDMMANYPNYLYTLNVAYDITSDLYHGFIPLNGDKQILAPLVLDGHCGGAGNPLATAPWCYMDSGTGEPAYLVAVHEMGHNFHQAPGMSQFLWANEGRFGNEYVYECVASFPVIYFHNEISLNGDLYGLGPGTYEWTILDQAAKSDRIGWDILEEFEVLLDTGQSTGFFDNPGLFNSVSLFCIFFQAYMYDYNGFSTPYDHHMIRRFLNIFDKEEFPDFQEDKVETYFAAAFSVSAGSDEREQLRHWGFTIDDEFYDQIEPLIRLKVREDMIFQSGFE